jgi:kynurenine formamidase
MPRIVDLTLTLTPGMRGVAVDTARTIEQHGWNATTLHLYSHCGTHMDAPLHFAVSNETIDQIHLERCVRPAWVINLTGIAPRSLITPDDLGDVVDRLKPGDSLLLRTGWSRRVHEPQYRDELPRVSEQLARWCVERQVTMLGVEPPSVADVNNLAEVTLIHRILLEGKVIIVEGLTHLDQLRNERVLLVVLPLKVAGGDGAPARALAVDDLDRLEQLSFND